jgi:hypothetical protein
MGRIDISLARLHRKSRMGRPISFARIMISALTLVAFLSCASTAADTLFVKRVGGGYDYYDFSYTFLGFSQGNGRGSYDFFDAESRQTSFAQTTSSGGLDFHDSDGSLYRQQIPDYLGGSYVLDDRGAIVNYSIINYSGGSDIYDSNGNPTSISTWHDHRSAMTSQP